MQNIPNEVVHDILQYLNPTRLHMLAEESEHIRYVVNGMNRIRYIEKWLAIDIYGDIGESRKTHYNNKNMYTWILHECGYNMTYEEIDYVLNNYWYFTLIVNNTNNYENTLKVIGNKKHWGIYLMLSNMRIIDDELYVLNRVYMLYLCECIGITNINILGCGTVYGLNVYYMDIKDVSGLGNINRLKLDRCKNIDDVSALANVHTLSLYDTKILDVSMLTSVYKLDIRFCDHAHNVGPLCNIHTLYMDGYCLPEIDIGICMLGNVHTLYLSSQYINIEDRQLSALANVYNLAIDSARTICNIGMLGNINNLHIYNHGKVYDVGTLGGLRKLSICVLNAKNIDVLAGIYQLRLYLSIRYNNPLDVRVLSCVYNLDLRGCYNMVNVSDLGRVHTLSLADTNISDVSGLGNVYNLDISYCYNISDVSALGSVNTLNIIGCNKISKESVDSLRKTVKNLIMY